MINWEYNKEVEKPTIKIIPVGNHRCRIEEAVESKSEKGNDMIKLTLSISGYSSKVWFYVVFMPEGKDKNGNSLRDITDRNLATIYETFGIAEGNLNIQEWIGKVGGVKIKHEVYNGEDSAKVHYFLNKAQQVGLPPWVESGNNKASSIQSASSDIIWSE